MLSTVIDPLATVISRDEVSHFIHCASVTLGSHVAYPPRMKHSLVVVEPTRILFMG